MQAGSGGERGAGAVRRTLPEAVDRAVDRRQRGVGHEDPDCLLYTSPCASASSSSAAFAWSAALKEKLANEYVNGLAKRSSAGAAAALSGRTSAGNWLLAAKAFRTPGSPSVSAPTSRTRFAATSSIGNVSIRWFGSFPSV